MASIDQPMGFRPQGEPRQVNRYIAGARCFPGDAVQLQADGKVDPAAAGATMLGVATSYADADGDDVLVSVDPDQVYIAQGDGSDIDAQTDVGQTCDHVATAGNTTYNQSRMELDSSDLGTGAGWVILGVDERTGENEFATGDSNIDVLCKINEHQLITSFAGV